MDDEGARSHLPREAMCLDPAQHLANTDPVMRRLIRAHGPYDLRPRGWWSPFQSLARAIAHQQLNATAANSILARFVKLFPGRRFPRPDALASVSDDALRGAGFSRAKVAALRDLAAKTLDGTVPSSRVIKRLSDDDIVARLTEVRGIGRWTVEMLLIFQLGRPDVLPADDFGVRTGFRHAYGLRDLPRPKDVLAHGERWRPHRTAAAWYLWRAADRAKAKPGRK
jgi:DNA-3-methyladenine glycosylase II